MFNVEKLDSLWVSWNLLEIKLKLWEGSKAESGTSQEEDHQHLVSSPWQRAVAERRHCHGVLSETRCGNTAPTLIQPWLITIGLLLVAEDQGIQVPPFREVVKQVTTRCLKEIPATLSRMSSATGKNAGAVARHERKLLWRILVACTFICNKSFFLDLLLDLLFRQTLYTIFLVVFWINSLNVVIKVCIAI